MKVIEVSYDCGYLVTFKTKELDPLPGKLQRKRLQVADMSHEVYCRFCNAVTVPVVPPVEEWSE
jgi:hypothetical protein